MLKAQPGCILKQLQTEIAIPGRLAKQFYKIISRYSKYSWHVQRPLEFQLGDCISKEQLITSRLPLNQTRPFLLQLLGWIKGAFAHTFLAPQGPRVHRWETQSDPWVLQSAALEEITLDDVKFQPNLTFPVSNWKEQQKPQKPNKNNADGTLTAKYEELGIPK